MPMLFRNVVPSIPAWTADNGKLLFGSNGAPSCRAPITVTATLSGTLHLSSALVSAGLPQDIAVSKSVTGTPLEYGTGQSGMTPYTTRDFEDAYGWSLQTGFLSTQVSGSIPSIPALWREPSSRAASGRVFLNVYLDLDLMTTWDATLTNATWKANVNDTLVSPEMENAIFVLQQESYADSVTIAADVGTDIWYTAADTFPLDPFRLGNGFRLYYDDELDFQGIDIRDTYFDVSAVHA